MGSESGSDTNVFTLLIGGNRVTAEVCMSVSSRDFESSKQGPLDENIAQPMVG